MKTAYIITSAIGINNDHPLTYSPTRTKFDTEERIRQTIYTVNSLDQNTDIDNTKMFLLDCGNNPSEYSWTFGHQPNLQFVGVQDEFPEIHKSVTTHKNKSYCESLMLSNFLKKYQQELSEYDYIFKVSGRYFVTKNFDTKILAENPDKIFYKRPIAYEWQDYWGYSMVDLRREQGNNFLYQYCSVLFGWSKKYQKEFYDMFTAMAAIIDPPSMHHYDIETLGYYLTRPYAQDIIETDWIISGWDSASGRFVRY
jgi:hypothetical protein